MDIDVDTFDETFFAHYGTPYHSGRYPYGSGDDPVQRHADFLSEVNKLKKQGLTEAQIAQGMGLGEKGTAQLRARRSIARNEVLKAQQTEALKLQDKGMSNVAIGQRMGIPESQVRAITNPIRLERATTLDKTTDFLKQQIEEKDYLDVGAGTEYYVSGVSRTQLNHAVAVLREQGYTLHYPKVRQLGTGKETTLKVLAKPGVTYRDVVTQPEKIKTVQGYTEDGGRTFLGIEPPIAVNSKRLMVNYAETGGTDKDGVIELRRNTPDLSLGASRYAQVRINVDGTHYLKGMAMYADDLPDGVDMRFNTNKKKSEVANDLAALKPLKSNKKTGEVDEDNPFGAVIRQKHYIDPADGKRKLSPLNIVGTENPNDPEDKRVAGEEGGWSLWSKSLSSQVLSKQPVSLAKRQLDEAFKAKQNEYDEIMRLTNPAVRKRLLESFADDADSSAVHLKAAALPRQSTHVILPMNSMKETEVYAPNFRDGEKVALVRYPHGGIFEIPELTVNNRAPEPNRLIKGAKDAIGINAKVAERLSGADFDGDTVLVIPNNDRKLKTKAPLKQLKGFDPKIEYKNPPGVEAINSQTKQHKMGDVSNLITDMTIKGASDSEIARAVRHSMVVIDAEKHNLDVRRSAKDHGIAELKKRYQGASDAGASTLISRSSSKQVVNERRPARVGEGGPINLLTGEKNFVDTGNGYVKPGYTKVSARGKVTEVEPKFVPRRMNSTKMAETRDARTLLSDEPAPIEIVYADHANKLKALGNQARKSYLQTTTQKRSPTAAQVYDNEVRSLKAKLNIALKNSPLERQAQLIAGSIVKMKTQDEPHMEPAERKKIEGQALKEARARMSARKERVQITDAEWKAIQANAISPNFLTQILANTDLDRVKQLATPRAVESLSTSQLALAKARIDNGNTQADVADSLGISTSKLRAALAG